MQRALSFLVLAALAACGPSAPPRTDAPPSGDSTVVVPSPAEVPADERPVVVFLGTSLTAGFGLASDDDTYVSRLVALADSAGRPFRAVNAGVSGETSAGGLRRLDWALREPLDVLFLELGANDGLRGLDPAALEENLTEIIRRTRARHGDVEVVLAGMEAPPNYGPEYAARFRNVYTDLAASYDVPLIPFLLEGVAGEPALNQADGIHPNAEGARRVADIVWTTLEPVVVEALQDAR